MYLLYPVFPIFKISVLQDLLHEFDCAIKHFLCREIELEWNKWYWSQTFRSSISNGNCFQRKVEKWKKKKKCKLELNNSETFLWFLGDCSISLENVEFIEPCHHPQNWYYFTHLGCQPIYNCTKNLFKTREQCSENCN